MVSLVRKLELHAIEKYSECPKYVTIVRHADLVDDSEFHCVRVPVSPSVGPVPRINSQYYQRNFLVPGQEVINFDDDEVGRFAIVRVLETEEGPEYWLISSVRSRVGFIIPIDKLPESLMKKEASL